MDFEFTPGHRKQLLSACRIRGQPRKTQAVRSIKCCKVPIAFGYSNVVLLSILTLRQSHKGVNSTVSDKPTSSPFPLAPSFKKYLCQTRDLTFLAWTQLFCPSPCPESKRLDSMVPLDPRCSRFSSFGESLPKAVFWYKQSAPS